MPKTITYPRAECDLLPIEADFIAWCKQRGITSSMARKLSMLWALRETIKKNDIILQESGSGHSENL